jgi:oligo-1,6-glucosidase
MSGKWWKKSVVYQVYPQSFKDTTGSGMGDLNGIIEKLSYLSQLGIDVIWLNPIYQSPLVDNGYDISDYLAINPEYGSLSDFKTLLAKAHELGIKIIMDLVVNHTSDQHDWFKQSCERLDNEFSDFYIWKDPLPDGLNRQTGARLLVDQLGNMSKVAANTTCIYLPKNSQILTGKIQKCGKKFMR